MLAERYKISIPAIKGSVVIIDEPEIALTDIEDCTKVAGIICDNPFLKGNVIHGNEDFQIFPWVAIYGKTPCRVIGPIKKGDLLTTSKFPGIAKKSELFLPGSIIGKAMQEYEKTSQFGLINVLVSLA